MWLDEATSDQACRVGNKNQSRICSATRQIDSQRERAIVSKLNKKIMEHLQMQQNAFSVPNNFFCCFLPPAEKHTVYSVPPECFVDNRLTSRHLTHSPVLHTVVLIMNVTKWQRRQKCVFQILAECKLSGVNCVRKTVKVGKFQPYNSF